MADGSEVWLNVHAFFVEWVGRRRYVKADATGKWPMVGMSSLHCHNLYMEVVEGGQVTIETQVCGLGGEVADVQGGEGEDFRHLLHVADANIFVGDGVGLGAAAGAEEKTRDACLPQVAGVVAGVGVG